jgi:hypothetical protein
MVHTVGVVKLDLGGKSSYFLVALTTKTEANVADECHHARSRELRVFQMKFLELLIFA